MKLQELVAGIGPPDRDAMAGARRRLDLLAKPPGSLGALEAYAVRLCGITGKAPPDLSRRAVLVFAADNGVCEEAIGSAPQTVTRIQTINCARGLTGVSVLSRAFSADVIPADVGMMSPTDHAGVRDLCVRRGTGNIRVEDAMTRAEAEQAVLAGASLARQCVSEGYALLGIGELGIGNTTTSVCVLAALTGVEPDAICGRGGGIGEARLQKKRLVIRDALRRAKPRADDPIGVLAGVGGVDICAMAGAYLGAASMRVPVVIDGLIGCVAALVAVRLVPAVRDYLFPSHLSEEPGAKLALAQLGLEAPLRLHLRLGEGSGCPLMFALLDAACAIYAGMGTFQEAQIDTGYLDEITK